MIEQSGTLAVQQAAVESWIDSLFAEQRERKAAAVHHANQHGYGAFAVVGVTGQVEHTGTAPDLAPGYLKTYRTPWCLN